MRFGVLGISNHFVKRVLLPLKRSEEAEIYAIASRSAGKAREFAREHGIRKWYGSYDALLNDKDVDAVYIPLPNHLHAEYIKKAADAGKHVLCEKPIALNYPQAREAIEYAQKRGILLMEAFMYRFHPQWIRAREIVLSGELGQIQSIHCYFSYDNKDPSNIRNIKEFGGGALLDIGVYATSTARFLLNAEPKRVLCLLQKDPKFDVDTLVSGMLDFGEIRSLFTVATQAFPAQNVEVYGTSGTLTLEIPFNIYPDVPAHVTVRTGIGQREILLGPADQYLLEFDAFAKAVRGRATFPFPHEDSLANMKTIDALFRSAESGKWEEV